MKIAMLKITKTKQPARGFTLIELLLYVAISSVILGGISLLLILMLSARVKAQTVGEVEGQGAFVMQEAGQAIRGATAINAPAPGAADPTLSLAMADSTKNPTVFSLSNGTVYITEGKGSPVALTSPAVSVSSLSFNNLSLASTVSQIVRVSYTVSYINKVGRDEYNYSKSYYDSFSLR